MELFIAVKGWLRKAVKFRGAAHRDAMAQPHSLVVEVPNAISLFRLHSIPVRVPMPEHQEALEEGCFAVTFERKYYHRGGAFIKRTLRPREFRTGHRGLHIPRMRKESIMNEAESLRYIRHHTNIPVPTVYCDFEDDDAYYLVTEYVQGVGMSRLTEDQKAVVREELEGHLATLQTLKSNRLGGPSGIVIPPYRVLRRTKNDDWHLEALDHDGYVFCHNDLSQQNVIVNPDTLKISAIIDWEYAGFYPARFEWPFYTRLGPSVAGEDEADDSLELLDFLKSRSQNRNGAESTSEGPSLV